MAIHSKVFIQILYIFETRNGLGKPQKLKRNLILERRFNDSRGFQACTAHLEMKIAVPSHFTTEVKNNSAYKKWNNWWRIVSPGLSAEGMGASEISACALTYINMLS